MATLESPFQPCSVLVDRRPLPSGAWTYDPLTGVLRAQIEEPHFRLEALACAP
jgi:hypothetical protein